MNKDGGWIFISHSHLDIDIVRKIRNKLEDRGFEPLMFFLKCLNDDNEIPVGVDFRGYIQTEIDESVRDGFVLLLVTENLENNDWIKKEIEYTNAAGGKIVPIYIGNATLDCAWDYDVRELQGVHLDSEPTKEQIEAIISHIEHRISYYNSDFAVSYGFQSAKSIQYPFVASIPDYTFWDCDNLETVYIPPCVSYISDLAFRKDQDILIICCKGSYAEQYCLRNNMRYKTET